MSDRSMTCPGCAHDMAAHDHEYGCEVGHEYDDQGIQAVEGCDCPLTIASLHR